MKAAEAAEGDEGPGETGKGGQPLVAAKAGTFRQRRIWSASKSKNCGRRLNAYRSEESLSISRPTRNRFTMEEIHAGI